MSVDEHHAAIFLGDLQQAFMIGRADVEGFASTDIQHDRINEGCACRFSPVDTHPEISGDVLCDLENDGRDKIGSAFGSRGRTARTKTRR